MVSMFLQILRKIPKTEKTKSEGHSRSADTRMELEASWKSSNKKKELKEC